MAMKKNATCSYVRAKSKTLEPPLTFLPRGARERTERPADEREGKQSTSNNYHWIIRQTSQRSWRGESSRSDYWRQQAFSSLPPSRASFFLRKVNKFRPEGEVRRFTNTNIVIGGKQENNHAPCSGPEGGVPMAAMASPAAAAAVPPEDAGFFTSRAK